MENTKEKEKSFTNINLRSFIVVVCLLTGILILAGVLTAVIPQGSYQYADDGTIIPGTFVQGSIQGIAFWRVLTAPFRVYASEDALNIIMISVFLLVMSGVFNVMEKTGGVKALIGKAMKVFSKKKTLVLLIAVLVFMMFGSFFGMFEELVTLLPIVIMFMLSMGYDTMTGLGVCMLAACFGFSAAITNPFSVGLASQVAGVAVSNGVWLRLIFFVAVYALVSAFILLYTRKIKNNPERSISYQVDLEKRKSIDFDGINGINEKAFKTYAAFFGAELIILIVIASVRAISGYAIPILAVTFLIGGIGAGMIVSADKKKVLMDFIKGAASMIPAVFMIALASSIKLVLSEGGIIDTIMHGVIGFLSGQSKFVCILLVYLLILILQIFIGSASAKIMLIMPIVIPICSALGISPATVILTYCMADGFTDMILPTNPVLLIGLSMANVSYGKWIKFTYKLQIIIFVLTLAFLLFAVGINY